MFLKCMHAFVRNEFIQIQVLHASKLTTIEYKYKQILNHVFYFVRMSDKSMSHVNERMKGKCRHFINYAVDTVIMDIQRRTLLRIIELYSIRSNKID